MAKVTLFKGEHRRLFDDRHRLALPAEFAKGLGGDNADCVLAKERDGCLSLWSKDVYQTHFENKFRFLEAGFELGQIKQSPARIQQLYRLASSRCRDVTLGRMGRLVIPEGFREFLTVPANSDVIVLGAGLCVEFWAPDAWMEMLKKDLEGFTQLCDDVAMNAARPTGV